MAGPSTSILYQDHEKNITLIDIPTSISLAQCPSERTQPILLSSTPLEKPYESTEPKSEAARANVQSRMEGVCNGSKIYLELMRQGLERIRHHHKGPWCLPRQISSFKTERQRKKRKVDSISDIVNEDKPGGEPVLPVYKARGVYQVPELACLTLPVSEGTVTHSSSIAVANRIVSNPNGSTVPLNVGAPPQQFMVPPHSWFLLANIDSQSAEIFQKLALEELPRQSRSAGPGQFDFILLDPPWENRSVKRSRRYTTKQDEDPMRALRDKLGRHIAPAGLVAIWITNKPKVKEAALEAFSMWGVSLIEEWVWLKVTLNGEPVYELEGLWRKPYEILLLGRKMIDRPETDDALKRVDLRPGGNVKLLVGVPDLHLRKPCLKELIEPILPAAGGYRALEIFARVLTEGWWSWGNEVLKFNWTGHWSEAV
ncbi:hypothetical protein MMC09_000690 [Bachmanniomyces sp. S44760]|nr:hypothetical protein [Bachmanniomyces sp. S44760]